MKRTRLNPIGKRRLREQEAREAFREDVRAAARCDKGQLQPLYRCARCEQTRAWVDAHHMCSKSRSSGHEWAHDADRNGAALCRKCHTLVTDHKSADWRLWIKTRTWLDAGGCLDA